MKELTEELESSEFDVDWDSSKQIWKSEKVTHWCGHEIARVSAKVPDEQWYKALVFSFENSLSKVLQNELQLELSRLDYFLKQYQLEELEYWSWESLTKRVGEWLFEYWKPRNSKDVLKKEKVWELLIASLPYEWQGEFSRQTPVSFKLPSGREVPIDYSRTPPLISGKLQEFFGQAEHPSINEGSVPLVVELLSPAMRPIQTTSDLISFWNGTYTEVRKEMKGKYPRHDWSETPLESVAKFKSIKNYKPRSQ